MTAGDLISNMAFPAKPSDNLLVLLDKMREQRLTHFPIVRYTQYLGLVNEDDLLSLIKEDSSQKSDLLARDGIFIYETQHLYDVMHIFHQHQLDVLPVLDEKQRYIGMITIHSLVDGFVSITGVSEPGGIIVLEVNNRDNALSHIAQIVESDNAQIMSSYVQTFPDSTRVEITLKLNRTNISSIVASFLRYDYVIKATFNDARVYDSAKDRYEQLMNYLNM